MTWIDFVHLVLVLLGFNWSSVFEQVQLQGHHIADIALHFIGLSKMVGESNPLHSFEHCLNSVHFLADS